MTKINIFRNKNIFLLNHEKKCSAKNKNAFCSAENPLVILPQIEKIQIEFPSLVFLYQLSFLFQNQHSAMLHNTIVIGQHNEVCARQIA
jgi:hypothetical protein